MQPCVYRDLADEAEHINAETGKAERVEVWLCSWPVTLDQVPPWLTRKIGSGLAIDPATDCLNCRVRKD